MLAITLKEFFMKKLDLNFKNRYGFNLAGTLDLPDNKSPDSFGIFAHCFSCSKQYKLIVNVDNELTKDSFGVFRFDFTGLGESEGDFSATNFTTNVTDLLDAISFIESEYGKVDFLLGHSMGAVAAIRASLEINSLRALVTFGAPYSFENLVKLLDKYKDDFNISNEALISIGGRELLVQKPLIEDISSQNIPSFIEKISIPYMIVHSPTDEMVPYMDALKIFNHVNSYKSFLSVDNANHIFTNNDDSIFAGRVIKEWLKRYIKNS